MTCWTGLPLGASVAALHGTGGVVLLSWPEYWGFHGKVWALRLCMICGKVVLLHDLCIGLPSVWVLKLCMKREEWCSCMTRESVNTAALHGIRDAGLLHEYVALGRQQNFTLSWFIVQGFPAWPVGVVVFYASAWPLGIIGIIQVLLRLSQSL